MYVADFFHSFGLTQARESSIYFAFTSNIKFAVRSGEYHCFILMTPCYDSNGIWFDQSIPMNYFLPFPEFLTNVFLNGEACPASVVDLTSASVETVTDALRDGRMDSCVEPKTLAHSHFRVLFSAPNTLRGIWVFTRGIQSCSPVHGMTMYGVTGCYGEVPCELRMCVAHKQIERSDGLICRFTCSGIDQRYALVNVNHYALDQELCEIYFH